MLRYKNSSHKMETKDPLKPSGIVQYSDCQAIIFRVFVNKGSTVAFFTQNDSKEPAILTFSIWMKD